MKKAILFGSSGFIGSYLLEDLLNNPDYDNVTVVVRKDLNITHPKLKTLTGDFHSLPALMENIVVDEVFITLGTTKKHTPKQDEYYQLDHDYPILASKIAKANGAKSVFIVTSIGADLNSSVFYIKTKGETERDIIAINFEHTHIFRPSMLLGGRKENRTLEKFIIRFWTVFGTVLIGKYIKYRGIEGRDVAEAMNNAAKIQSDKIKIYQWQEMHDLL